ncbi:hypothetical protein RND81_09G110900 [Saponaria officinalis]|uniref:RING-type E3 ubiquitin transferase n=1 Tax=Saponaria officinalis TaxID=3572 RepID=A0AAW1IKQ5_SAPOF
MEEKKEIVIPCEHLPWDDWKFAKRVVLFHVGYVEFERVIDCESKSAACTLFREIRSSTDYFHLEQDTRNPVDCQECKANIVHYLTNVISHPHPNLVMADMCTRFDKFLHHGTPNPEVIPYCCWMRAANKDLRPRRGLTTLRSIRTRATRMCLNKLAYLCGDTCLKTDTEEKEYPVVEDVCYQIQNYTERHCLSRRDNMREWRVSWLGIRAPRPHHPRLFNLNLTKVDQQNQEVVAFTCPICLQGQVKKLEDSRKEVGEKRKRDDYSTSSNKKKRSDVETMEDIVKLPCQHIYHGSCINQWLQDARHDTCPMCRFKLLNTPACTAWVYHQISSLGDFTVFKHIHQRLSNDKLALARSRLSKGIKW